ncbi:calcium-binding protein [Roseobacter sp. A03A-229]
MQGNTQGNSDGRGGGQNGGNRNRDTIDLEDLAGASDVDLDLSDVDDDGFVAAQIDTDGDGTTDETIEFELPDRGDVTVVGTDGDNTLLGSDGDDTFIGSAGNDAFVGGDGDDTIDYSDLGAAISISSAGGLDKGGLGTDTLGTFDVDAGTIEVVETVIGDEDERNVVDSTSVQGAVATEVDLSSGAYIGNIVEDIGGFSVGDAFSLTLENFVDVLGSDNDDQITGSRQANLLTGAAGADVISGGGGQDRIIGGTGDDSLTGGRGADIFEFAVGDGSDVVTDFNVGVDALTFTGVGTEDIAVVADETDTTLSYGDSTLLLADVVEEDLSSLLLIA